MNVTPASRRLLVVSGLLLLVWLLAVSDQRQPRVPFFRGSPAARTKPIEYERFYGVDPTRFILYSPPGFTLPHDARIPAAR